ncbi:hypothetical protein K523DRAFT_327599 [Schizophyllum commune Tattone D]|nr:hypothetical protein K523DRAFT_327599 [Schizophyllum commune Tattone D]
MRHAEPYIGSEAQLLHWLKTTDANLTFIGDPIPGIIGPEGLTPPGPEGLTPPGYEGLTPPSHEGLTPRGALATTVVYCSVRNGNTCDGPCTVHNGDPECLYAPNTNCLFATGEVTFCAPSKCDCPCNLYSHCGTRMDNGFCWTPGTNAIYVGGLFPG